MGDIIENWKKYADGRQTIAFSPSIKHSMALVEMFRAHGIPAEHIDGYMDDEERQWIYEAHDNGEFKMLSCSRLLNTGYDAPAVSCMIDAFPTSSLITWVQQSRPGYENGARQGRRDHPGSCRQHSETRFRGLAVPDALDDCKEKRYSERNQLKEKKEPVVKDAQSAGKSLCCRGVSVAM